ncbi:MAG: hypothetical protein NVS3B21_21180 [Acidimicrobiales bacterium]
MTPGRVPEAEGVDVIHPWEVVGVLIALCSASAYTGFRYARDLAQADAPTERGTGTAKAGDLCQRTSEQEVAPATPVPAATVIVPITGPPPATPATPIPERRSGRARRDVEAGEFIDLHERLGPWGRRPLEPHSDADAEDDRGRPVAMTDLPAAAPRAASDR